MLPGQLRWPACLHAADALKAVDAFVFKNDAPVRLLPVITRVCGEIPSEFERSRIIP